MSSPESFQHRRNLRLPEFDYSQPGAYFVTVVTQGRKSLFGKIVGGEMILNEVGNMIRSVLEEIPDHYHGVLIEIYTIMPNHVHILFGLDGVGATPCGCPDQQTESNGQAQRPAPTKIVHNLDASNTIDQLSLPDIVHRFKSLTTNRYMNAVRKVGWDPFVGRFWQRNYYEHVIRNEKDHQAIYEYILTNPINWEKDEENVKEQYMLEGSGFHPHP